MNIYHIKKIIIKKFRMKEKNENDERIINREWITTIEGKKFIKAIFTEKNGSIMGNFFFFN